MKTATVPKSVVAEAPVNMGSEYMDARTFVTQWTKAPRVKDSDETFHGSNASDFGVGPVTE